MPKGKKVKINMKEFIAKHGLSEEKPVSANTKNGEEEWEDVPQNQQDEQEKKLPQKQNKKQQTVADSKKTQQKEEDDERKKVAAKKQATLKGMIKHVMNDIVEQRQKHSFPIEIINEVSKEPAPMRLIELFEHLHLHYFKVFDIFKKNGHHEMERVMEKFSAKILGAVRELKQARISEINSSRSVGKEEYSEKILKYYSMELKLKEDEIKKKKYFRENARGKFTSQIKQLQDFISINSRLVSESMLRQQFQSVIEKVVISNGQIIAQKQRECNQNMKQLFWEWRRIKREKIMLKKINRAEKIGKNEKWRNIMSGRFTNFEGVLLNHFNIYEQEK